MKIKFNRIAIIPVMCDDCKMYMWLEKYRHSDVYAWYAGEYVKRNICNNCIERYKIGRNNRLERKPLNENGRISGGAK